MRTSTSIIIYRSVHKKQNFMDNSSGQQPQPTSKQRRKRKDPESRDFVCKCSKSYLSYAAAYTHVKNKHGGDKDFLEKISKPDRERLKRGRPKERRQIMINTETELLSIIEETILQIYEAIKDEDKNNSHKIVLEGNEELKADELMQEYEAISKSSPIKLELELLLDEGKYGFQGELLKNFIEGMKKHFLAPIAAKIAWTVNYLASQVSVINQEGGIMQLEMSVSKLKQSPPSDTLKQLWKENPQIISYIVEALEKWMDTNLKSQGHDK